jgi:hypothetical protein
MQKSNKNGTRKQQKKVVSKLPPIFLDLNEFPLDYKEDNDDQLIVHLWEHL